MSEPVKIVQITQPSDDWCFVHKDANGKGYCLRVVLWGVTEQGHVVGLLNCPSTNPASGGYAGLIPPVNTGQYCRLDAIDSNVVEGVEAEAVIFSFPSKKVGA